MNIQDCKDELYKIEQSYKKKYPGDAAKYSFKRHVLMMLQKLCKGIDDEPKEVISQKDGEQRFECSCCKGTGYTEHWETTSGKDEYKLIQDCISCEGNGFLKLNVIDKRKISRNKVLEYSDRY